MTVRNRLYSRRGSLHILVTGLPLLLATFLASPASAAIIWRAVMVGPHYPGGAAFDDTIAGTRMTNLRNQFARWGNWNAANIDLLTGAVTSAQITQAIAGAGVDEDDFFAFVYHGHGSYTNAPKVGGNNVGDPEDELYALPPLNNAAGWMSDNAVRAALAGLPPTATKLAINLSCYGGGFWDDLSTLNNIAFYSGAGETQTLPEPPIFYDNLFVNADPRNIGRVDTNHDNNISIAEYYNASKANGSIFGFRWLENFEEEIQSSFDSQYNTSSSGLDSATIFTAVPEPSTLTLLGLGAFGLIGHTWWRRERAERGGAGGE